VSAAALDLASRTLGALDENQSLEIVMHQATYETGLVQASAQKRSAGRTLALFLGSNIGNFDPPGADAFLLHIRAALAIGDFLLIGTDLVKSEAELLQAYDDPLGVTAAFNRNLLVRINRELGADFDPDRFQPEAFWVPERSRMEMFVRALEPQTVHVRDLGLTVEFAEGERLRTEISTKFTREGAEAELASVGLRLEAWWTDRAGEFALCLAQQA
jgi:L-histidine Nalpha-methyltransferase